MRLVGLQAADAASLEGWLRALLAIKAKPVVGAAWTVLGVVELQSYKKPVEFEVFGLDNLKF